MSDLADRIARLTGQEPNGTFRAIELLAAQLCGWPSQELGDRLPPPYCTDSRHSLIELRKIGASLNFAVSSAWDIVTCEVRRGHLSVSLTRLDANVNLAILEALVRFQLVLQRSEIL